MSEQSAAASDAALIRVTAAGDSGVLVRLVPEISERRFVQVMAALSMLDAATAETPGILDIMPGYASLLVVFDPLVLAPAAAQTLVRQALAQALSSPSSPPGPSAAARRVDVPVLYDPEVAPDLLPLCREKGLTLPAFVAAHTAPLYRCHLLGFRPGFAFLGGLPAALASGRLATPRLRVPGGSVGIAGQQTGVYPAPGPGGWRIVGRTPLAMLELARSDPFLIHPGDRVSFLPIDRERFVALGGAFAP